MSHSEVVKLTSDRDDMILPTREVDDPEFAEEGEAVEEAMVGPGFDHHVLHS